LISVDFEFYVRLANNDFNDYVVTMFEINPNITDTPLPISFVFDTGAAYTMLNKTLAESRGWEIFYSGLEFGSYVKGGHPLVCDLRKIPRLAFGVRQIEDLVVATPQDEKDEVSNLLGRSFTDNFHFGVNQDTNRVYFKKRNITINPSYSFSSIAHMHQSGGLTPSTRSQ